MVPVLAFIAGVFCLVMAVLAACSIIFAIEDKSIAGVALGITGSPACLTMGAIFLSIAGGA